VVVGAGGGGDRVAAQSDKAHGIGARFADVEGPDRVERIELIVQSVAAILGDQKDAVADKGDVVEAVMLRVAEKEDRDFSRVPTAGEIDSEDRPPGAARGEGRPASSVAGA